MLRLSKTTWYYLIVGCFLSLQVLYTIYANSLIVSRGQQIQELLEQQQQLVLEKQLLEQRLSEAYSLSRIKQQAEAAGYIPISRPLNPLATPAPTP